MNIPDKSDMFHRGAKASRPSAKTQALKRFMSPKVHERIEKKFPKGSLGKKAIRHELNEDLN